MMEYALFSPEFLKCNIRELFVCNLSKKFPKILLIIRELLGIIVVIKVP